MSDLSDGQILRHALVFFAIFAIGLPALALALGIAWRVLMWAAGNGRLM